MTAREFHVRAGSQGIEVLRVEAGDGPSVAGEDSPDVHRLVALDYRGLFDAVPTPCAVLTVDAVFVDVNAAYERAVGRPRGELVGRRLADALPGNPLTADADAVSTVEASLRRAALTGETDNLAVQRHDLLDPVTGGYLTRYWSPRTIPIRHGDGVALLVQAEDVTAYVNGVGVATAGSASASSGAEANLVARTQQLEQVNRQLREARDQLAEQALRDPLTGLLVRPVLLEATNSALARLRRHDHAVGMLFIDLDRLKFVNDTYGHAVGDELLRCCAGRLRASVRPTDSVARIGGDEFVVLLDEVSSPSEAELVAERVLKGLSATCPGLPVDVAPVASIGVAVSTTAEMSGATLLAHADAAMYRAKANGRGRIENFDEFAYAELGRRNQTEADLRSALPHGELRLHYQPILDLDTGSRYAVEALLRWQHPERGLLAAGEFIDVAEDSALIVELGRWVVGEACRQLAAWDAELGGDAPQLMFVNLSAAEITHPDIGRLVRDTVERAGIAPARLVLEITETGLMAEPQRAAGATERLRELGCELAIDDFGAGYSSLSRLVDLPAGILKIDQSFVRGLARNPESMAVVSAVLLLAHNLRKLVVAEGVEDEESLQLLRDLGCRYAQGFHLGRPAETLR